MSDETLSDASSSDGDDDDDASGDGSDNGINGTESESEEEEKWSDFESDAISTASYESSVSTEERVPDSTRRANSTNEHRSLNNVSTFFISTSNDSYLYGSFECLLEMKM